MKNITVSVPEPVYEAARRKAAERGTSMSRLVREYLVSLSREDDLREERRRRLQSAFEELDRRDQPGAVGRLHRDTCYGAPIP